ncbi:MAG: ATP-binding protein, partial [Endozoicomonas sp.]
LIGITFILVIIIAVFVSRRLVRPIRTINQWVNRVASGDYVEGTVLSGHNEISDLSRSFSLMTEQLRTISNESAQRNWLQEGMAGLNNSVRGEQAMAELCRNIVMYIARYLDMHSGAMYVLDDQKKLQLLGTYAWRQRKQHANRFEIGEGLVGQAALEKQSIELFSIPEDYLDIESGMGRSKPAQIMIIPLVYEDELKGVLELARLNPMTDEQRLFLDHSVESIAIAVNSAQYRARVNQLLDQTTLQSEAMKEQQEELRAVNEELEKRARILEESEEELKAQSEEMQKSNTELEEKSEQLMQQKEEIEQKNNDIELSSRKIAEKAEELEQASRYKSEFLANMSHELRTPLNSLLLLSQMLAENDEGNLTEDQMESAQVIYNGGKELLDLINDILDLSKVEAGKMSVNLEQTDIEDLGKGIRSLFNPLADSRSLEFMVTIEPGTTRVIFTDSQRLMQIIKNFLSNAFKFTEQGGVYVRMFHESRQGRFAEDSWVGFAIRDSGIGIPKDKQESIFESFQQADGSTSRKYGGTGLGLAISREMAELLGGFIEIESEEGKGTTFTLFLPDNPVCSLGPERVMAENCFSEVSEGVQEEGQKGASSATESALPAPDTVALSSEAPPEPLLETETKAEEKEEASSSDRCVLLIEDDSHFTDILSQIAERHHFTYRKAQTGSEGLEMARKYKPSAIILDLGLPDMDGQQVLEKLKEEESTRAIPIHIISGRDPDSASRQDAIGYLVKPASMADLEGAFCTLEKAIRCDIHHALILDADEEERSRVGAILERKGMTVGYVASAAEAEAELANTQWQCLVMDLDRGDLSGIEFLRKLKDTLGSAMPSVVI